MGNGGMFSLNIHLNVHLSLVKRIASFKLSI